MIAQILLFLGVCAAVSVVNVLVGDATDRSRFAEFVSTFCVIAGGIAGFTAVVVAISTCV